MLRSALGIARAENAELQAMLANTAAELEHAESQAAEHGQQLEEIRAKVSSAAAAQTEAEAAYAAKLASQVSELLACRSALEEARAEAAALTDSTGWPRVLTRLRADFSIFCIFLIAFFSAARLSSARLSSAFFSFIAFFAAARLSLARLASALFSFSRQALPSSKQARMTLSAF